MSSRSAKNATSDDRKLSRKHLIESVKFNQSHAKDHEKAMKKAQKRLAKEFKVGGRK